MRFAIAFRPLIVQAIRSVSIIVSTASSLALDLARLPLIPQVMPAIVIPAYGIEGSRPAVLIRAGVFL